MLQRIPHSHYNLYFIFNQYKQLLLNIFFIFLFLPSPLSISAEETGNLSSVRDMLKSGKISEASALLQKEVIDNPGNAEAHLLLGRTYLLEANEVRAVEEFDKASSIKEDYKKSISSEYFESGLILIKNPKRSNIGLHYLNKYLLENQDKTKEVASILYKEGFDMTLSNKFMSHVILDRAKELNPSYENDEEFYFAYSVKSAHKPDKVVKGGEEFLSKFPKSSHAPEVLYLMGEASLELRKPQDSRKYFKQAYDEFPETEWGEKAKEKLK